MDILTVLSQFGLGLLGMAVVVYMKFRKSESAEFDFKFFWKDNKKAIISTLIGLPLILVVLALVPSASEVLNVGLGLDIDLSVVDTGGAFTLGMVLYEGSRTTAKKKAVSED